MRKILIYSDIEESIQNSEKFLMVIPLFSLLIGSVAGVVCFYFISSIIPASNVVVAIIIGAASDLTATGANQIFKQFNKDKEK